MKRINIITFILLLGSTSLLYAHDFTVTGKNGEKFFFNIVDAKKQHVEVTYQGNISAPKPSLYTGEISVPARVKHNNTIYRVVGIGKKAFSNAASLKGIVLPSGLSSIGDFAFEGCSGLEKIVFPGNSVRFGEGVFFRCTAIGQVTLGSDWTQVNLKMFRWSDRLTSIVIPAKLTSLQNLKSLKQLQSIEVDANNPNFTSIDGILYNKDKTTLLGCPRGRSGKIRIPEGTTAIRWKALIDCPNITQIDLPTSLQILSYREFSQMEHLEQIIMRRTEPISTAELNGQKVFLIKIAGKLKIKLLIPKTALSSYKEALCSTEGEYAEVSANTPEGFPPEYALIPSIVEPTNMLGKSMLSGVKDFSKYDKP